MSDSNLVDSTKLMDVVFTVSGGVYGMVKDKINNLYTSGVLQGKLPKGAIVTGLAFDVANDAIKLTFAISSGDLREVAKVAVSAAGGATGTYIGGLAGASAPVPLTAKPVTMLVGMVGGSIAADAVSEWAFDTYVWPKDSAVPTAVSGGGISLGIDLSSTPQVPISANAITTPADAPTRNSDNYITDTSANDHLVVIKAGGKVWDAYVAQRNSATGFNDWNEYKAAVAVSNPGIADLNQIPAGITLYMPEKLADGSVTYHYANGASINNNATIGEYHMVVPNTDGSGGQTVYSRVYAGDMDGPNGTMIASYVIKQVSTNEAGAETFNYNGVQQGLGGDILPQSLIRRSDTDGNGSLDQMEQTLYDKNKDVAGTITDTPDGNGGFNRHISTVVDGKTLDVAQHIDASKAAVDKDGDGDFIDAGDATTTGVLIDGQEAVNSDQIEDALDAYYGEGQDLIDARDTGRMDQFVNAGDASDADGWEAPGNVDESCSALKDIAIKSIRTRPRGQLSRKSHAVYAGTRERGRITRHPEVWRPKALAFLRANG